MGAGQLLHRDGDPVSLHTMASAAFEILQDLNVKAGNTEITQIEMARRYVTPEHVPQAMQLIRKPMLFFKQDDRDPRRGYHTSLECAPGRPETISWSQSARCRSEGLPEGHLLRTRCNYLLSRDTWLSGRRDENSCSGGHLQDPRQRT